MATKKKMVEDSNSIESESLSTTKRVVDRLETDGEFSPMRVVESDIGPANQVKVGGTPISEYDNNDEYPADDPVVEVVFEKDLDHRVTDWREHVDHLSDYLDQFAEEWNVTVNQYAYPQSRLKEVPDPVADA